MKSEEKKFSVFLESCKTYGTVEQIMGVAALTKMMGIEEFKTLIGKTTGLYLDFKDKILNYFKSNKEDQLLVEAVCSNLLERKEKNPKRYGVNGFYGIACNMKEIFYPEIANMEVFFQSDKSMLECGTPQCLCDLVIKMIPCDKDERISILDIGSGRGDFLTRASTVFVNAQLFGQEINTDCVALLRTRAKLLGQKMHIRKKDVLADVVFDKFDYVFSQPPFGMRLEESSKIETQDWTYVLNDIIGVKNKTDFLFINIVLNHIKENGKGYIFVPNGVCFRGGREREWRQQLVQDKWLEAVITLPANLFKTTRIPCTLLILSNNNKKIKMIEAEQMETKSLRGFKELTKESINQIVGMYLSEEKTDYSAFAVYEEIMQNDFLLTPINYVSAGRVNITNPKMLVAGVSESLTGVPLTGKNLDEKQSANGNVECLRVLDFNNYGMVGPLKRIKISEKEMGKYQSEFVQKRDLIIVTKGNYKSMIADFDEGEKLLLLSPNLTILRLNQNVWNPYYIKAFLDSPDGQAILNREYRGTGIPVLQRKSLMQLPIPEISIEKQIQVEEKYCKIHIEYEKALEQVEMYQNQFEKILNQE